MEKTQKFELSPKKYHPHDPDGKYCRITTGGLCHYTDSTSEKAYWYYVTECNHADDVNAGRCKPYSYKKYKTLVESVLNA